MSDMTARNIKTYRKKLNMTQEQLAKKVGVSVMSIRRYEAKGEKNREPSADLFDKIAQALGITSDILRGKTSAYKFKDITEGKSNISKYSRMNSSALEEIIEKILSEILSSENQYDLSANEYPLPYEDQLLQIISNNFKNLNADGQKKLVEYSSELAEHPKYKK